MSNLAIGIEGLVGSGKTSLCRELKNMIPNTIVLHGGNLYRGIIVALMQSGIDLSSLGSNLASIDMKSVMDMLKVEIKIEDKESVVYVNGTKIDEDLLQSDKASMAVSTISKSVDNSKFYIFARKLIDGYRNNYNIIISGRDIMQIYPDIDYHFFITASLDARVERKANQYKNSINNNEFNINELRQHIEKRDMLQEQSGYYKRYEKTIDVDVTDCKNPIQSAKKVLEYIKEI